MDELTKLLAELVAIPSVNPMGRNLTGPQYGEENIAQHVWHYLKRAKIDVEIQPVFPGRPNVLGFVDIGARETMLLEAHLDTVPVDNMAIKPFDPVVKNDKVFGRGACDTKSSLAVILFSLKSLLASRKRLSRNIIIAAVCDEEYGLNGTKAMLKKDRRIHYAIVGEPTGLEIINCHKGVVRWRMSVHGKSAHSAYPQQGVNAILHMAHLLGALEQHSKDLIKGKRHRMLGSATLSVGIIEGGQSVNTVPNLCTIEIDRRTLPGENAKSITKTIAHLVPRSIRYSMPRPHLVVPSLDSQQNRSLVRLLNEALRRCGRDPRIHGARYVTDASLYAAKGIPSAVFGPGRIEQAHSEREFVRLSEVRTAVDIYRTLLTAN